MRSLVSMAIVVCSPAIAQVTIEDWKCYQIVNAVSVGGGKTNLTCNAPHGYSSGTTFVIYGATGSWAPLDTQIWNAVANPFPIGATDTTIQVNDSSKMIVPGFVVLDAEKMYVTSVDADHIYLGPGGGCATGRGCSGTTATTHGAQDYGGWSLNANNPLNWTVTVIDPVTLQINLDSSTFGSFSGQTNVHIRRTQNSGTASVLGQIYLGQPWASYDDVTANGLQITIPACTVPASAFLCAKGFLTLYSGKGYSFNPGGIAISSFVVSGTPPNQVATVTFATPFSQPSATGANTMRTVSTGASWGYSGALVYTDGFDETATGLGSLNRPYMIQSMTTVGSTVTQVVLKMNDGPATVPNGTYVAGSSSRFSCSSRPCLAIPWPGDPYADFNLPSTAFPSSAMYQFTKYGAAWNNSFNRLRLQYRWDGISQAPYAAGAPPMDLGGYIYAGTDPTDITHTYQDGAGPIVGGNWAQLEWSSVFEHVVGANNNYLYQNEAAMNGGWYDVPPSWGGGARPFWASMGRIYWDWSGPPYTTHPMTGGTITYRSITLNQTSNEPLEYVHGTGIVYDGAKYQVNWVGPRQNLPMFGWNFPVSYNVAYSTSDLKTIGYSHGTSGGSVSNSAGSGDTVNYSSAAMPQAGTIYFGIRPVTPIWGVSPSGSSPIWFWTIADYGLDSTSHVTTTGVGGSGNVTAAAVNSVQPRQFWTLYQAQSNVPWTTPGTLTSITSDASGNCTVHLNGVNHNLTVGWPVMISNAPSAFGGSGTQVFNVTATPTSSTFVFSCPLAARSSTFNTDTFNSPYWFHFAVMSLPGVSVAGTASGISPSSPTMVSTDDNKNFAEISFTPASGSSISSNPCDLSGDGVVDSTDVGISISMVLNSTTCNGGLQGLGTCTVVDTERVINAQTATGGTCRTGP